MTIEQMQEVVLEIRTERGIKKRHSKAKVQTPVQKVLNAIKKLSEAEREVFLQELR